MKRGIICRVVLALLLTCLISGAMASDVVTTGTTASGSDAVSLPIGKTTDLKKIVKDRGLNIKKLTWVSSDETVATVKNGTAKGVSAGEAIITASGTDEAAESIEIAVTVVQPVQKISFSGKSIDLAPGVHARIGITVAPDSATNRTVSWSSSNKKIATVDDSGTVTAHRKGKAKITAAAVDGSGVKESITVRVDEYDLVFTDTMPQSVTYVLSGKGKFKVRGSVKNGNVSISEINSEEPAMTSRHKKEEVTVTPVRPGTDTITIKVNNKKLQYTVFVADYFEGEETQDEPAPETNL